MNTAIQPRAACSAALAALAAVGLAFGRCPAAAAADTTTVEQIVAPFAVPEQIRNGRPGWTVAQHFAAVTWSPPAL